jgi:hypothetical protein
MNEDPTEFYDDDNEEEVSEIQAEMNEEIASAPQASSELIERLMQNTAASPADSGGDIDADWEDVNVSGDESVFGDSPTPDQSDVEENAHAMGINFEDNEPLDFIGKMEKRDRDRFELDESSKGEDDSI